jgi:hypothetical protein
MGVPFRLPEVYCIPVSRKRSVISKNYHKIYFPGRPHATSSSRINTIDRPFRVSSGSILSAEAATRTYLLTNGFQGRTMRPCGHMTAWSLKENG